MATAGYGESLSGRWRRERGWDLSISRAGVSFRSYAYLDHVAPPIGFAGRHAIAASPLRRRLAWLAPLIAGGTLAAGVLAAPIKAEGGVATLSIPIPAPVHTERFHLEARAHHRAHAAIKTAPHAARADAQSIEIASAADERAASPESDDAMQQRFVDVAMRTGEVQSWQTDSARYFLVAGDAERAATGVCRQFSLLARGGLDGDSVQHFERCRAS